MGLCSNWRRCANRTKAIWMFELAWASLGSVDMHAWVGFLNFTMRGRCNIRERFWCVLVCSNYNYWVYQKKKTITEYRGMWWQKEMSKYIKSTWSCALSICHLTLKYMFLSFCCHIPLYALYMTFEHHGLILLVYFQIRVEF